MLKVFVKAWVAGGGVAASHCGATEDGFEAHLHLEEPVWSRPEEEPRAFESPSTAPVRQPGPALTTAAELATGASNAPSAPPEAFLEGMLVRHPEYGLGKIVALSGFGPRRTATVNFTSSAGQKKFVLQQSPLRPLKSN